MVFAVFLTAPIWGSIGDKGKRKTSLVLSTLVYGILQMSFSLVDSVFGILVLRLLAGAAAGGFHVGLMSALIDVSSDENRKVTMAKYSAVLSVSSAIGFLIGGLLGYFTPQTVFIIQGLCMIVLSLGMKLFLKETNPQVLEDTSRKTKFIWNIVKDVRKSEGAFAYLLFFTLYTILLPILQGFAVEGQTKDIGFMTGMFNAIKSLGEMVGALIAGFSYNISSRMPFLIAAISFTLAFLLSIFSYLRSKKERSKKWEILD